MGDQLITSAEEMGFLDTPKSTSTQQADDEFRSKEKGHPGQTVGNQNWTYHEKQFSQFRFFFPEDSQKGENNLSEETVKNENEVQKDILDSKPDNKSESKSGELESAPVPAEQQEVDDDYLQLDNNLEYVIIPVAKNAINNMTLEQYNKVQSVFPYFTRPAHVFQPGANYNVDTQKAPINDLLTASCMTSEQTINSLSVKLEQSNILDCACSVVSLFDGDTNKQIINTYGKKAFDLVFDPEEIMGGCSSGKAIKGNISNAKEYNRDKIWFIEAFVSWLISKPEELTTEKFKEYIVPLRRNFKTGLDNEQRKYFKHNIIFRYACDRRNELSGESVRKRKKTSA